VLRDLTFRVGGGTTLAILGPNASGKTVLFRALIGAIPFAGSVRWAPGTRIGYVPQKLDLERDIPMTGMDFLRARAALLPGPTPSDTVIARTIDMEFGKSLSTRELSGGVDGTRTDLRTPKGVRGLNEAGHPTRMRLKTE